MTAYYNERDPYTAAWLRVLVAADLIAPGDVDERDILDVRPGDLAGYAQCHFFAGIGVWSYALRRAGWPDDRRVWTGSCPCQPFSAAGKGDGFDDERHLWPTWFQLLAQCAPPVVWGEQVASKDGLAWLDLVHDDLEGAGYAVRAEDLCAAGVGAPHIRQRLFFVARPVDDADRQPTGNAVCAGRDLYRGAGAPLGMANGNDSRLEVVGLEQARGQRSAVERDGSLGDVGFSLLANADGGYAGSEREQRGGEQRLVAAHGEPGNGFGPGPTNGYWRAADWLACRDDRWRPVEPGAFPLAHGAPARVGRLRAYGNAIVAPLAEAFISAYMT